MQLVGLEGALHDTRQPAAGGMVHARAQGTENSSFTSESGGFRETEFVPSMNSLSFAFGIPLRLRAAPAALAQKRGTRRTQGRMEHTQHWAKGHVRGDVDESLHLYIIARAPFGLPARNLNLSVCRCDHVQRQRYTEAWAKEPPFILGTSTSSALVGCNTCFW